MPTRRAWPRTRCWPRSATAPLTRPWPTARTRRRSGARCATPSTCPSAYADRVNPPCRLVLVSGCPGAGKTTLAVPLAAELGCTLLSKDRIKETLHDGLGAPVADRAWSRRLGAAAMELLWALAADAPSVVLEANFRPRDPYQRRNISALAEQPVEVWCQCDPELAARRYNARARTCHPIHVQASVPPDV